MHRLSIFLFAAAIVAAPLYAHAEDPDAGGEATPSAEPAPAGAAAAPVTADAESGASPRAYTKAGWPKALTERPLTLAKGMVEIHVDVLVSLTSSYVGKPIAIAPDIFYGVSDKLTVGLTHGLGLCLTGTDSGNCPKLYNDVGVAGLFSLKRDAKMELAAAGSLDLPSLSPMIARLDLGVNFKLVAGKIGIWANPRIGIGLNKRADDPILMSGGNKESLSLPITIGFQATPALNVHVRSGLGGPLGASPEEGGAQLSHLGDTYTIPLGVGALFAVSNKLDVGAEFFFPGIAGSDLASTDDRALVVQGNVRL